MAVRGSRDIARVEKPGMLAPFEDMERWFEEAWRRPFGLLRSGLWPRAGEAAEFETMLPNCDIYEEGKELVVKADLPGMKKEDIEISVVDNILTVSGERKAEQKSEKANVYRYERTHGSFFRRFELPYDIDSGKVKAHFEDGVLEIRLPKTEEMESKTKKIAIS